MSRSLTATVEATLGELVPARDAVMRGALEPVLANARARWPVRKVNSLDSRGKLDLRFVSKGDSFIVSLGNDAPYAGDINGGATAEDLIFTPAAEATERATRDLVAEFERRAGRI
jgi:hypothetical protein